MNSKERCLAAVAGREVDRAPVFPLLMYLAMDRAGVTYRQYATSGHALAQSQLKVRQRFAVDAITSCSDAFRIAADLGADMVFPESNPPYAARPLVATWDDLRALRRPDALARGSRMADRTSATAEMVRSAGSECLVLGWVDMPFAEACSLCGVSEFMVMMMDAPDLARAVLEFLTPIVIDFALAQVASGAPMIGAGDAAASLIGPVLYRRFALPFEQRVCEAVHAAGGRVKLHICGNTRPLLEDMIASGADLFNVDHLVPFSQACQAYGRAGRCFKGNLDPVSEILQATSQAVRQRALACLREARGLRYMLSAGCEVPAAVSDEAFDAFCAAPAEAARS